ncbi:MAG: hypothetical protein QOC60_1127 [Frankiaceae bacterium]|jgi:hypothetical protein|nr:hypothetical protein [Frankiaceae bacterium]
MLPLPALPQLRRGQLSGGIRQLLSRIDRFTRTTFDLRTPSYRD